MADDVSIAKVNIPLARSSGLPPVGIYRCIIQKVELKDGASGFPYLSCECSIDDPKFKEYSGRTFYTNLSLSPQARWKLDEAFDALGAPEEGTIDNTAWFHGKRFYAFLTHHTWEGRTKLQVDEFIDRVTVKDRLAAWEEHAATREAEEKAKRDAAREAAEALAPDEAEEPVVAEPEVEEEPELDAALEDLWAD